MGLRYRNLVLLVQIFSLTLHFKLVSATPVDLEHTSDQNDTLRYECPEDQLYHNETQSCELIQTQGPCGEMMKFVQDDEDARFGKCECDEIDANSNCTFRPKIYWPAGKRCYKAFDQGPCFPNQWLTLKQSRGLYDRPICVLNPCPKVDSDTTEENQFWFPFGGMCYMTGTQGFCREPTYRVHIMRNGFSPACLVDSACPQPIPEEISSDAPCNKRAKRYVGKCRKKTTFSFPTNVG